jgi:hypothetical protein
VSCSPSPGNNKNKPRAQFHLFVSGMFLLSIVVQ